MQVELMPFQHKAVGQVLKTLRSCRRDWVEDRETSGFALSAPTGSGKTVIASAVIEALLHGSDEFDFEPDPTATVLWVTKDPALNEQTKNRLIATADRMPINTLHVVDNTFTDTQLAAGHLYFINTAKLAVTSLLVRRSNARQVTFWEVLDNTIRNPQRTLYVILDEAHEGMKPTSKDAETERLTLVRQIIDGDNGCAATPIVWGISATIDRFTRAMEQTKHRTLRSPATVTAAEVQESGLLKSSLEMLHPDEPGDFTTTLIREAAQQLSEVTSRWSDYCAAEQITPAVRPLMVVQIPNREDGTKTDTEDALIVRILDTIRNHLTGFTTDQVGHVLGDRDTLSLGQYTVLKVQPELVQDHPEIRVLMAKDAVSTGWDCPRAEVLVSLRPAKDRTYITQLLGRMVRTPLARSTSDQQLNSAAVFLPLFDKAAARLVADDIMGRGSGGGVAGPAVLLKPINLVWNPAVPQDLKGAIASVPSLPKPAASPRPVKRLLDMAATLAGHGLADNPTEQALGKLCGVIDGIVAEHKQQVDELADRIRTAELMRVTINLSDGQATENALEREADARAIGDAVRYTRRLITTTVANAWLRQKYTKVIAGDPQADLTVLQARLAAVGLIDTGKAAGVQQRLDDTAEAQVDEWFDAIRAILPNLSEEKRDKYDRLLAQARTPQETHIELPTLLKVESVNADGNPLPTVKLHVLADQNGEMPVAKPTSWETEVLARELDRGNVVGWYRNPSAGKAALQIAYKTEGGWRSVQPDFIMFENNADSTIGTSIVDPHSPHLADAMPKLRALADYAERYAGRFNRIDAVAKLAIAQPLRVLELTRQEVREAVRAAADAKALFAGPASRLY